MRGALGRTPVRLRRNRVPAFAELEPVPERIGGVEAPRARDRLVPRDLDPRAGEPLREGVEAGDDEAGVRLAGRREGLLDADVQLLRPGAEPAAAARGERGRLRQLLEPEEAVVERPR